MPFRVPTCAKILHLLITGYYRWLPVTSQQTANVWQQTEKFSQQTRKLSQQTGKFSEYQFAVRWQSTIINAHENCRIFKKIVDFLGPWWKSLLVGQRFQSTILYYLFELKNISLLTKIQFEIERHIRMIVFVVIWLWSW